MRTDDARCSGCGWEGEVLSANFADRGTKVCGAYRELTAEERKVLAETDPGGVAELGVTLCGGALEFLPGGGAGGITRFGFGFQPSFGDGKGAKFGPSKRRPATVQKG